VETATVIGDNDVHLTQRIFTVSFRAQIIFDQFDVVSGDAVDCLINGVYRAVTVRGFGSVGAKVNPVEKLLTIFGEETKGNK